MLNKIWWFTDNNENPNTNEDIEKTFTNTKKSIFGVLLLVSASWCSTVKSAWELANSIAKDSASLAVGAIKLPWNTYDHIEYYLKSDSELNKEGYYNKFGTTIRNFAQNAYPSPKHLALKDNSELYKFVADSVTKFKIDSRNILKDCSTEAFWKEKNMSKNLEYCYNLSIKYEKWLQSFINEHLDIAKKNDALMDEYRNKMKSFLSWEVTRTPEINFIMPPYTNWMKGDNYDNSKNASPTIEFKKNK